jgi:hypothetical protein
MLAWLKRWRQRRKLSPVVSILPWALTKSYGAGNTYTPGQITRACEKRKIEPMLVPYALAAYCNADDLTSTKKMTAAEIEKLRAELVTTFDLSYSNFNVEDIRRLKIRETWNPMRGGEDDGGHGSYGLGHGSSDGD